MLEEPTQETSDQDTRLKNPFSHSWQRIDQRGNRVRASLPLLPADQRGASAALAAEARTAGEAGSMSQERLAYLIHEHTAAIAALGRQISTREAIRRILRVLALEEITLGQALGILAEMAERIDDPEQRVLHQQAIATLQQIQAEEP